MLDFGDVDTAFMWEVVAAILIGVDDRVSFFRNCCICFDYCWPMLPVVIVCFIFPFQFATGLLPCLFRVLIRKTAIRCEEHITYCLRRWIIVTRHVRRAFIGSNDKRLPHAPCCPNIPWTCL